MRITRAEKSVLSDWWFTVDRLMFFGLLLLMGAGLVLSLAASPPIAAKYNLEPFYFVRRQAALLLPAVVIMVRKHNGHIRWRSASALSRGWMLAPVERHTVRIYSTSGRKLKINTSMPRQFEQ